jgi:hypothetical protein
MTETRTEERHAARPVAVANPRRTRLTGTHSGDLTAQLPLQQGSQDDEGR